MDKIKSFLRDETGMETMEYALIAGLVVVVTLLVYGSGWGNALRDRLQKASNGQS